MSKVTIEFSLFTEKKCKENKFTLDTCFEKPFYSTALNVVKLDVEKSKSKRIENLMREWQK